MNAPTRHKTASGKAKTTKKAHKAELNNKRSPAKITQEHKPDAKQTVQDVVHFVTSKVVGTQQPMRIPTKGALSIPLVNTGNDDIMIQQQQTELSVEEIEEQISK